VAAALKGSALALILYDVAEEIRLEELRPVAPVRRVGPSFKHTAPQYVRFARPPVVQDLEPLSLPSGQRCETRFKCYDYGVVSVLFEFAFEGDWTDLIQLASRWMASGEFEHYASTIAHQQLDRSPTALAKPYTDWLVEDYFIFHLTHVEGSPSAQELVRQCGDQIADVVRGETETLSPAERGEVLQSSISYYPSDLAVIGWHAAFLYDTVAGAQTAIQLLEYANSQLLEFRHYDEWLTRELDGVYRTLDRRANVIRRWGMAREAARLQTVTLEVTELAERAENAIKFLSDMFAARLYRIASAKVGVLDYEELVNQKLRTAHELYGFMIEQFQQGRAFVLELMVVIILIIELGYLFRGK
jgi:hypothetical protein